MNDDFTVIDFSADGVVTAMDRPQFPLGFLGKQSIQRASDLRFDEGTQLWDINVGVGDDIFISIPESRGFPSYTAARDMEVAWFEACRLQGVMPLSAEGITILNGLRGNVSPT